MVPFSSYQQLFSIVSIHPQDKHPLFCITCNLLTVASIFQNSQKMFIINRGLALSLVSYIYLVPLKLVPNIRVFMIYLSGAGVQ